MRARKRVSQAQRLTSRESPSNPSRLLPLSREIRAESRPLWRLAWPVILAEVGWHSMTLVDTMIVGRVSAEALGGVSVGSALFFVAAVFGIGMLLGLDYSVSHAVGRRRDDEAAHILGQGVLLATVIAVILTFALRQATILIAWIGVDPPVYEQAAGYLDALSWSLAPILLFNALRRYIQAVGAVKVVMLVMISANLVNAAAAWVLVFGHLGFPALGARGAGWATLAARLYMLAGAAAFTWYRVRQTRGARPLDRPWFDTKLQAELIGLGLPAALQLTLEVGVFSLATALAGRLGPVVLAAHHIVLSIAGLTFMLPLGLSSASAVRVGHHLGSDQRAAAAHSGWTALIIGIAIMSCTGMIFWLAPRPLLSVFTNVPEVIATGSSLLLIAAVFQIFDGIQVVGTGILRGTGETRIPMVANLIGHWLIGLPTGYWLCFVAGWGVTGIWVGLSIGLIVVALALVVAWQRRAHGLLSPR